MPKKNRCYSGKNSLPDKHGVVGFLQHFGVPYAHGACYQNLLGYECYSWSGCDGEVEYFFDMNNKCVAFDMNELKKIAKN